MGRRSCHWRMSQSRGLAVGPLCKQSYLVTKSTHAGTNRLLPYFQSAIWSAVRSQTCDRDVPVYFIVFAATLGL